MRDSNILNQLIQDKELAKMANLLTELKNIEKNYDIKDQEKTISEEDINFIIDEIDNLDMKLDELINKLKEENKNE